MSEQERAKIDRFIAWLLEHPEKIPVAKEVITNACQNPLRIRLPKARRKGFYLYRVNLHRPSSVLRTG